MNSNDVVAFSLIEEFLALVFVMINHELKYLAVAGGILKIRSIVLDVFKGGVFFALV